METLGIIAGSGQLPFELARAAHRTGFRVAAVGHRGETDETILKRLVDTHLKLTGSRRAKEILEKWSDYRARFVKVFPKEYRRALGDLAEAQKKAAA